LVILLAGLNSKGIILLEFIGTKVFGKLLFTKEKDFKPF